MFSRLIENGSLREYYIAELSKYINVDIYGKCGKRFEDNEDPRFTDNYFFYLAFENSQCKDYITEKLYTILRMVGLFYFPIEFVF